MAAHHCHATGCTKTVPPRMLMCGRHWKMVPGDLQDGVWATYRPGQEISKDPSREYLVAARAAINAVAEKEGRPMRPGIPTVAEMPQVQSQRCPVHNMPDCSPLLNGCSRLTAPVLQDFG